MLYFSIRRGIQMPSSGGVENPISTIDKRAEIRSIFLIILRV
jgi:hypothetical protein